MQEKYNIISAAEGFKEWALFDENKGIAQLMDWASDHTKLCQQYVGIKDEEQKKSFLQCIEKSLAYGQHLSTALEKRNQRRKIAIPLSGEKRFSRSNDTNAVATADMIPGHRPSLTMSAAAPLKRELASASGANLSAAGGRQAPPLPSRTYLQKKYKKM